MDYRILNNIKSPEDVKKLNEKEIPALCAEIRNCIIDTVSKNGGHLASNLGAVELTVALHRTFSSPQDAIIFDVGHQCYTHKLLTGRFDRFNTLRKENGISGFMKPGESIHDPFITGHSSNSISAAYGIYKAKCLNGEKGTAIAVIGDGAMTGGMVYEALNNVGSTKNNFLVVLNDNKMSISRNVGALARSFTKMRNKPKYHSFKFALNQILQGIPFIGGFLCNIFYSIKETFKNLIYKNNFFSALGFNYLGPVDGHDVQAMESLFKIAQNYLRPSLIHVVTTKGKGYPYAEQEPKYYHGVSPFDVSEGACSGGKLNFSAVAGKSLCDLAEKDSKICAITAAMTEGTGLTDFSLKYKSRFFDVGIAEQHAVTFAAGLAKGGLKPYFAVYSSFLQRAYDQIIHDAAIGSFPIKLLIDRAGIVGEDGETHQGIIDVSFLTSVPNINIYSPFNYKELEYRISFVSDLEEISAIRYPRGCENQGLDFDIDKEFSLIEGASDDLLITYGKLFSEASVAKAKLPELNILKLNKIYPFSEELINTVLKYKNIHFFEESIKNGGIAEHLASVLYEKNYNGDYKIHSIENKFVAACEVTAALKKLCLDSEAMVETFNKTE